MVYLNIYINNTNDTHGKKHNYCYFYYYFIVSSGSVFLRNKILNFQLCELFTGV